MRRFILKFWIALLTFTLGLGIFVGWRQITSTSRSSELTLRFVSETPVLRVEETPSIKLYITNNSDETVTLVHPGDGSYSAWRTPVVQWSIREAGDLTPHPTGPDFEPKFRICGNTSPLKWSNVFRLSPGETKEIKAGLQPFTRPGSYRVQFFYANRPSKPFLGIELGTHNPIAMLRVKYSTECTLTSNEVLFSVTE